MAEKYNIDDIHLLEHKKILFDANIIIYLFFTTSSQSWQAKYSRIYRKLLMSQSTTLYLDYVIISEIINKAFKETFELRKTELNINLNYKDYRDSEEGRKALKQIHYTFDEIILPRFSIEGWLYTNINEIKSLFEISNLDFNDKHIVKSDSPQTHLIFLVY